MQNVNLSNYFQGKLHNVKGFCFLLFSLYEDTNTKQQMQLTKVLHEKSVSVKKTSLKILLWLQIYFTKKGVQ